MLYDVPYERLGAARFHQFCLSLLAYEYPDLQAFPVDMPDAGRDGYVPSHSLCIQVKFTESLASRADPVGWLASAIRHESGKWARLAAAGVTHYRIVTNVVGTGALHRGGIDRVARVLAETPFADAQCLWRPDLDARLAHHPELRLTFYELLTAEDVLSYFAFGSPADDARRSRVLRSFLAVQHAGDQHVRFRQIDLQSELLRLWIDVPVSESIDITALGADMVHPVLGDAAGHVMRGVGAAEFLLHGAPRATRRVTILGAPGQGKSTLGQYLCQVHRMRLLRHHDVDLLGSDAACQVRVPVRVELRSLPSFLSGHDPFAHPAAGPHVALPPDVPPTFLGFLAHLISRAAGGDRFDAADLKAIAERTPLLLVLDGLDEIPTPGAREAAVDAIEQGVTALDVLNPLLQVLVLSRPLFYSRSDRLPGPDFDTLTLGDVPYELAIAYARKWSDAKGGSTVDADEAVGYLTTPSRTSDIAWLTQNTMQLGIVLELLRRHTGQLPTRRTRLYEQYMSLVLMREAAKSATIREHEDEVVDLHGYIAWRMHAAAEDVAEDKGIRGSELRDLIEEWLHDSTIPSSLAAELFEGVALRVMALVSRSGDWFEFEVQPLREYLCARHLYQTVVPGQEEGDLADRFDALARNPYWGNVIRFFTGFFERVQRPAIVDRIAAMAEDPLWSSTGRHVDLARTVLNDRVLEPVGHTVRAAVDIALRDSALPFGVSVRAGRLETPEPPLSQPYPARYALAQSMRQFSAASAYDRRLAASRSLCAQQFGTRHADEGGWLQTAARLSAEPLTDWIIAGAMADELLEDVDPDDLLGAAARGSLTDEVSVALLLRRPVLASRDPRLLDRAVTGLLRGARVPLFNLPPSEIADLLTIFRWHRDWSVAGDRSGARETSGRALSESPAFACLKKPDSFRSTLVDDVATAYPNAICVEIAALRIGRPTGIGVARGSADSTVRQTAYLADRTRSRRAEWWLMNARRADERTRRLAAFALVLWGDVALVRQLALVLIEPVLAELTDQEVRVLRSVIPEIGFVLHERLYSGASEVLAILLGSRLHYGRQELADRLRKLPGPRRPVVDEWIADQLLRRVCTPERPLNTRVESIETIGRLFASCPEWAPMMPRGVDIPEPLAETVWRLRGSLPLALVLAAQATLRKIAVSKVETMRDIARAQRWFATMPAQAAGDVTRAD